ncbi:uncharacterized protein [Halyomorpha halys]|uniref:uncharacterized protein isoform X2 n=1 Tax=Halyomorpha halys TaxID=286706 RepID=UPI0034D26F6B
MSPIVLSLAIIVCVSAAQPLRSEMASEELYPGFPRESAYEEAKQMRNLDSIEHATNYRELVKQLDRSAWMRGGTLDSIGGGHLVRDLDRDGIYLRQNYDDGPDGHLDTLGGGHLLRDLYSIADRNLDSIGGGHLVRNLDTLGGGHLVRNLDTLGGGHLVRNLDTIGGGHLVRNLDTIGGGHLLRQNREYLDSISGKTFGSSKRFSGPLFAADKRNGMDEIDRVGFNTFIKKKNFDEIDRSGFDGFVKRNFDEIDRAGFNGFVKRSTE